MNLDEFEYLDEESEKVLRRILQMDDVINVNYRGASIAHLVNSGFVLGVDAKAMADLEPVYVLQGVTQKGKTYFENKKRIRKEKRKFSRREWYIAIVSSIIGAVIGLIPSIIQWLN